MKKIIAIIVGLLLCGAIIFAVVSKMEGNVDRRSVSYNGFLTTSGAEIQNRHSKTVQLTGISTHGIQWYGDLYDRDTITHLKDEFGINVFRVAMYVNPDDNGYIKNRQLADKLTELIDICIELDIYAIIDWHILNDNNPQTYQTEALAFFDEMSKKYADVPNVIYEICNEPNGKDVIWSNHIKPYAEAVAKKIHENSPKALVIVGTPDWSKDLTSVSHDPLEEQNVAYALHFYAGSHNKTLRDKIDEFREKNLPVFVSECGATDASGDGKLYDEAFTRWVDYLDEHQISWVYWSYSNKGETSAMLTLDAEPDLAPSEDEEEVKTLDVYLSDSGRLVKNLMTRQQQEE